MADFVDQVLAQKKGKKDEGDKPAAREDFVSAVLNAGKNQPESEEQSYISKVIEKALKETSVGIAARSAGLVDEPPGDLGMAGNIGAGVLGFVADPATYATGGIGAIIGKGIAKKAALTGLASRVVPASVQAGVQLGGLEAVRGAAAGEFDPAAIAKSTIAGAALGPTNLIRNPVGRFAAEAADLAVVTPALEGRLPTGEDVAAGIGMATGFRIVNPVVRRLAALATKENISRKEYMEATGAKQTEVPPAAERKAEAQAAAETVKQAETQKPPQETTNAQNEVEAQAEARPEAQGQETGQAQGASVLGPATDSWSRERWNHPDPIERERAAESFRVRELKEGIEKNWPEAERNKFVESVRDLHRSGRNLGEIYTAVAPQSPLSGDDTRALIQWAISTDPVREARLKQLGEEGAAKSQQNRQNRIDRLIADMSGASKADFLDRFLGFVMRPRYQGEVGDVVRGLPADKRAMLLDRKNIELLPHTEAEVRAAIKSLEAPPQEQGGAVLAPGAQRVTATPVSPQPTSRLDAIINRARIEEMVRGRAESLADAEASPRAIVDEFLTNIDALPPDIRRQIEGRIRKVSGDIGDMTNAEYLRELVGESIPFSALDSPEKGIMAQLDVLNEMMRTVKAAPPQRALPPQEQGGAVLETPQSETVTRPSLEGGGFAGGLDTISRAAAHNRKLLEPYVGKEVREFDGETYVIEDVNDYGVLYGHKRGKKTQVVLRSVTLSDLLRQPPQPAAKPVEGEPSRVQDAVAKRDAAYEELQAYKAQNPTLFSTGVDPKLLALYGRAFKAEFDVGWATFKDYVAALGRRFGAAVVRTHKALVRDTWENERKTNPKLDPAGDVDDLLRGIPDGPAETTQRPMRDGGPLPDLAVPVSDPMASEVLRGVDEVRTAADEPRRVTHAEADAVSNERIAREGPELADRLVSGVWVAADSPDTFAQVKVLNALGQQAAESGDWSKLIRASLNYRAGRTQTAQALEAGKAAVTKSMTQPEQQAFFNREALIQPPPKVEKAIKAAQKREFVEPKADDSPAGRKRKTAEDLAREWAGEVEKLRARLKGLGHDVDRALQGGLDPVAQKEFVRDVHALKSTRADQLYEWWSNSILSAPATQIVNAVGNTAHAGWYFTAERMADAFVSSIARAVGFKSDGARFGELKPIFTAFIDNWGRSAKNFFETWHTEVPQFYAQRGLEAETAYGHRPGSIPGKVGKTIRTPWRTLAAVDDFTKTQVYEMERAALAYRKAASEGLKGDALRDRMRALMDDLEIQQRATDTAIRLAFQEKTGFGDAISRVRDTVPGGRYVLPFITTPFNIVKTGVRKSPFGSIKLAKEVLKASQSGDWSGISQRTAEQVLAWGAALALAYSNDPANPWITGGDDPNRKYSIRIGGQWYSYGRIEPFATTVGLLVDGINRIQRGEDLYDALKGPFDALLDRIDNQTFFAGLSDFMKAARYQDANYVLEWGTKFPSSWVPNLIRAPLRATEDEVPQRRTWGKGSLRAENALRRGLQSFEVMPDLPKYDLWGRPVPKDGGPIPHTDWVFRTLSPVGQKKYVETIGDRLITKWNAANPQDRIEFKPPNPYFIEDDTVNYFTDQEYADYVRESGRLTHERITALEARGALNMNNPTKRDIERLEKAIESSRTRVRNAIKRARRKREKEAA